MVSPQARREAVGILTAERDLGVTRACGLVGISRSLYGQPLDAWLYKQAVRLAFIRPGKPVENAYVESLNGR